MTRKTIKTDKAPQAIGTYSQAVKTGNTVYLAGQIPLIPETMTMESGDMRAQIRRVFENLSAVAQADYDPARYAPYTDVVLLLPR